MNFPPPREPPRTSRPHRKVVVHGVGALQEPAHHVPAVLQREGQHADGAADAEAAADLGGGWLRGVRIAVVGFVCSDKGWESRV
jgi:hypothetical protein